jgi:hypothetical protein
LAVISPQDEAKTEKRRRRSEGGEAKMEKRRRRSEDGEAKAEMVAETAAASSHRPSLVPASQQSILASTAAWHTGATLGQISRGTCCGDKAILKCKLSKRDDGMKKVR